MTIKKPRRVVDKELREKISQMKCLVCFRSPCDPAHVKTRGSGGGDVIDNLMPLCRSHHSLQHRIGISTFALRFQRVFDWLTKHGWTIEDGRVRLA